MAHHRKRFRLTRYRLLRIKQYAVIALISAVSTVGFLMLTTHLLFRNHGTDAVNSAKASNIISNLRNLKTGAVSWYDNNKHRISLLNGKYILDGNAEHTLDQLVVSDDFMLYVMSYNHNPASNQFPASLGSYTFNVLNDGLYVGYIFGKDDYKIRAKISGRAASIGLVNSDGKTRYDKDDYEVYLLVVNLSEKGGTQK